MLKLIKTGLLLILINSSCYAAETKPSEESIKKLDEVTEAHKLLDNMMIQMESALKNSMQKQLQGQAITPEKQKILENMQSKTLATLKQEFQWDQFEKLKIRIYQESFSQQEIDGMIEFYKTPAGQAVTKKLPLAMSKVMAEMQQQMIPLTQKLTKIQQDTLAELKK